MTGIKYDKGKPLPDLVLGDFMPALEHPVFVGTFGASKYAPKNFQTLEDGETRYAEAHMRHYIARKKGELFDEESGELHIAHEIWDKIAELYFWLKENGHRVWKTAIQSKTTGLYFTPHGDWTEEPYWWGEHAGRQAIWALAREMQGELDIRVHRREVTERWIVTRERGDFVSMLRLGRLVWGDRSEAAEFETFEAAQDLLDVLDPEERAGCRIRSTKEDDE